MAALDSVEAAGVLRGAAGWLCPRLTVELIERGKQLCGAVLHHAGDDTEYVAGVLVLQARQEPLPGHLVVSRPRLPNHRERLLAQVDGALPDLPQFPLPLFGQNFLGVRVAARKARFIYPGPI